MAGLFLPSCEPNKLFKLTLCNAIYIFASWSKVFAFHIFSNLRETFQERVKENKFFRKINNKHMILTTFDLNN
jgi:hypothetical protein